MTRMHLMNENHFYPKNTDAEICAYRLLKMALGGQYSQNQRHPKNGFI